MKKLSGVQKIAIGAIIVFVLFVAAFFAAGSLMRLWGITSPVMGKSTQALLAFLFFLPLWFPLFFWGQACKKKAGWWQTAYKLLTFVSVALFLFSILQLFLSIFGVFG